MRLNRKGDLGFPEAIVAVMIVSLVLTSYLSSFVIFSQKDGSYEEVDMVDQSFFDDIDPSSTDIEGYLLSYIEEYGYSGAAVDMKYLVSGDERHFSVGIQSGHFAENERIIVTEKDNGTTEPVRVTVRLCA